MNTVLITFCLCAALFERTWGQMDANNPQNQQPIGANNPTSNFPQNQVNQQPMNPNNPTSNFPQNQQPIGANNPTTNFPQNQVNQQPMNPNNPTSNLPQNQQPIGTNNPTSNFPQNQVNQQPINPNNPSMNLPQNQGNQQFPNGASGNQNLENLKEPKQPINIGTLNVQPSQFIQNFAPLQNQISQLKQVHPAGCQRLKDELRRVERMFENQMKKDEKIARVIMGGSRMSANEKLNYSTRLTEASKKASTEISELSVKLQQDINSKCKILSDGAIEALSEAEKQLQEIANQQQSTANRIAEFPRNFNKQMQDAFVPVDTLINT